MGFTASLSFSCHLLNVEWFACAISGLWVVQLRCEFFHVPVLVYQLSISAEIVRLASVDSDVQAPDLL